MLVLILLYSENCPRQECEYFVGLGLNPSDPTYLDVYLDGNAAGWVAIGVPDLTSHQFWCFTGYICSAIFTKKTIYNIPLFPSGI